eukprot:m.1245897 g.1245897  ORF g.1245897 m.1245897 type:complete len:69 (-) comp24685_c0_seq23:1926-2132(-)
MWSCKLCVSVHGDPQPSQRLNGRPVAAKTAPGRHWQSPGRITGSSSAACVGDATRRFHAVQCVTDTDM